MLQLSEHGDVVMKTQIIETPNLFRASWKS